jgi:hypothetical protein
MIAELSARSGSAIAAIRIAEMPDALSAIYNFVTAAVLNSAMTTVKIRVTASRE